MVKFGRHLAAFAHEREANAVEGVAPPYIVPYSAISATVEDEAAFVSAWRSALDKASADHLRIKQELWKTVFGALDGTRGLRAPEALAGYRQRLGDLNARVILSAFNDISLVSGMNGKALRKLVKKFDKRSQASLSTLLLPELYTKLVWSTPPWIEASLLGATDPLTSILTPQSAMSRISSRRSLLGFDLGPASPASGGATSGGKTSPRPEGSASRSIDETKRAPSFVIDDDITALCDEKKGPLSHLLVPAAAESRALARANTEVEIEENHAVVLRRSQELSWLRQMVRRLPADVVASVVAHRGFHSPSDRSDRRPLENSLAAFEEAWTSGVQLCECDVATTRDGLLVLSHDESGQRLALIDGDEAHTNVSELTFAQVVGQRLKCGSRMPLLIEVLRSAQQIGNNSQLVIELKPGYAAAATALCDLFELDISLLRHCAVIMTFDAHLIHRIKARLRLPAAAAAVSAGRAVGNRDFGRRAVSLSNIASVAANTLASLVGGNTPSAAASALPQLMLLTVSEPPKRACDLRINLLDDAEGEDSVGGPRWKKLEKWLGSEGSALDGVYMQFEPDMLTRRGQRALRALSSKYKVGVWMLQPRDPDDLGTVQMLRSAGVSFVNTDLPKDFAVPTTGGRLD